MCWGRASASGISTAFKSTVLSELTLEQSLDLYYALFGYDKRKSPASTSSRPGLLARLRVSETKRSVASREWQDEDLYRHRLRRAVGQ